MHHPKISIILVTYNRAQYIEETIGSIIAQTYRNWELLIIDNGSDDETASIIQDIADSRITYEQTSRLKMGPAKNIALRKASGDLIAFMDDDDLWMETKLEKQVEALLAYPDAGFCYTNGYNFRNGGEIVEYPMTRKEGMDFGYIFESYCKGERGIYTIAVIFWKECLKKTGYFTDSYFFTDNTFISCLTYYFKGVTLYEPLFKRRLHAHNTNSIVANENRREHLDYLKSYKAKGWLSADIAEDASFLVYINSGNELTNEHNHKEAIVNYLNAWSVKPLSIIPAKKLLRLFLAYIRR
ncbi:glycosyltransferase family 2 protein [Polluticoccus soli]|uniref:glycosyltransferase family 2 protein n=1 Tax=Polluticoccus soli TaxID=3034150 RepID=UPI0023E2C9B6|nr:glycosyltransferase family A protein [Flavipsychrobacter sp. JY13-12]